MSNTATLDAPVAEASTPEPEAPKVGMKAVFQFFGKKDGQTLAGFSQEWKELSLEERAAISAGIADGSLTY